MSNYTDLKAALKAADTDADRTRKAALTKANTAADAMNAEATGGGGTTPPPTPEPEPVPPATSKVPKVIGQSMEYVATNVPKGKIQAAPAYFQPGDFTGSNQILWSGTDSTVKIAKAAIAMGAKVIWFSYKDGKTDAAATKIDKFIASLPNDQGITWMHTHYHEHNGNIADGSLTLADFKLGCKNVAAAAHKAGHLFGPNHNGMNKNSAGKWGFWPEVWEKMEGDVNEYDFWSFDGYCPKTQDPGPQYMPAIDYAKKIGKPVCQREFSAPNGPDQAAWATKMRAFADQHLQVATWWSSQVNESGSINYRMTEASAKNYYKL